MSHWYWITAIGEDRPGIVADLAERLAAIGGNIEDASMNRFHQWFAVMVLAATESELSADDIGTLQLPGLRTDVHVISHEQLQQEQTAPTHRVSVYGADRPGIVATVSRRLANAGTNILNLEVDVTTLPQQAGDGDSAEPLFVMVLDVSSDGDLDGLEEELRQELGMEVHVVRMGGVVL